MIPQNPPWLTRQMVRVLPKSVIETTNMRLSELRQQEEEALMREMNRIQPHSNSLTEKVRFHFK